jgi:hypothetical protein
MLEIIIGIIAFIFLLTRINNLQDKISQIESKIAKSNSISLAVNESVSKNETSTINIPNANTNMQSAGPVPAQVSAQIPVPTPPGSVPSAPVDNEEWGGRALGIVGVLAVIAGISLFLRYAFTNNWIGVTGRVAIGLFAGLIVILIGQYFREKYRNYSNVLIGCGIGILYLTTFAAFAFYNLISSPAAYGLLIGVTALSVVLSIVDGAMVLAMVGVVGGFLTPIFMTLSNASIEQVLTYILILDLGVMITALVYHWRKLAAVSFAGTWVLLISVFAGLYKDIDKAEMCVFLFLYFVIFLISSVVHHIVRKESSDEADLGLITVNALSYAGVTYSLLHVSANGFMGFFMLGLSIVYFLISYVSFESNKDAKRLNLFLPAISALFLTIAIPAQFDGPFIALAWFVEAIILYVVDYYLKGKNLYAYGGIVFVVGALYTFARYADSGDVKNFVPILNERFFIFVAGILTCYILAVILARAISSLGINERKSLVVMYFVLAQLATLFIVTTEISSYYQSKIYTDTITLNNKISQINRDFQVSNSQTQNQSISNAETQTNQNNIQAIYAEISDLTQKNYNERNTVVDVFWILYAIVVLGLGFAFSSRMIRTAGLVMMFATAVKIFVDIWALGQLYRIVTSMVFGVIALIGSFVYAKYKNKFNNPVPTALVLVLLFSGCLFSNLIFKANIATADTANIANTADTTGAVTADSGSNDSQNLTQGRSIIQSLKYRSEINSSALFSSKPARFQLTPSIEAATNLNDMRIFTGISAQVPYKIVYSGDSSNSQLANFPTINLSSRNGDIEFMLDTKDPSFSHSGIDFKTGSGVGPSGLPVSFRYSVDVYGSDNNISIDSSNWRKISGQGNFTNQYIFNFFDSQTGQSISNTRISYGSSNARYIKVVLTPLDTLANDNLSNANGGGVNGNAQSIIFKNDLSAFHPTNVDLIGYSSGNNLTAGLSDISISEPIRISENPQTKSTEIYIDSMLDTNGDPDLVNNSLGVFTNAVTLKTSSTNFYRHVVVQALNKNHIDQYGNTISDVAVNGEGNWQTIGDGFIYSLPNNNSTIQKLTINYPTTKTQQLRLLITNDDNAPLSIKNNLTINSPAVAVVFIPSGIGPYYLYYNNGTLSAPVYDIDQILSSNSNLQAGNVSTVSISDVSPNPAYKKPAGPVVPFSERYPWFLNASLVVLILFIAGMIISYVRKVAR